MTIMQFKYTKSATDVTERVCIPLVQPTDKWFCIDVSDLDIEDQAFLENEIARLDEERKEKIDALMAKYDVKDMYRSFIPTKMSEIVIES